MNTAIRLVCVTALAAVLHLLLGWEWTLLAGLVAGFWQPSRGWLLGAAGVGSDYLALVTCSYIVDAHAIGIMTRTMGALTGNMPSEAIVAITLLIGTVIGALGGAAGTHLRRIADVRQRAASRRQNDPATCN